MSIKNFIPKGLDVVQNPLVLQLTIIFNSKNESEIFYYKYLINSELKININPQKNGSIIVYFNFPKHNYTMSIEPPKSTNKEFENSDNKLLEVTSGFISPNGSIGRFSPSHKLANRVTFN